MKLTFILIQCRELNNNVTNHAHSLPVCHEWGWDEENKTLEPHEEKLDDEVSHTNAP